MATVNEPAVYTQQSRPLAIATPLGEDVLLLRGFEGDESISSLFRFDLDLLSTDDGLDLDAVVGKGATVRLTLADGEQRYFSGIISKFSQGGRDQTFTSYHAELVPWLWLLGRTANCRIFQRKTVPEIIGTILNERNFKGLWRESLHGPFKERDYCVQYRETDLNFLSRLMEEEGIYYFFAHENGKHTLMLADSPGGHPDCPKKKSARYHFTGDGVREEDVISEWRTTRDLRPGQYTLNDFNFEDPEGEMVAQSGKSAFEIYDYPGEYMKQGEGQRLARLRLEEMEAPHLVIQGSSDCRAFTSGYKFRLTDHFRRDCNKVYVITQVHHSARLPGNYRGTSAADTTGTLYENSFECIPHTTPFRAPRLTPKPVVQGSQTAIVVGPAGEEILTDKYGRVKVQFHWDREGKRDEDSSCWIRVSQPWAGKDWGAVSIPRIGQEVIVDFLEGDPDRPIITGRVYNALRMPPYPLPDGAANMGFKSKSIKGGGYNEIAINDTNADEGITIHAQHNMQTRVEHDETISIGNNRTEDVAVDENLKIGNNRAHTVGVNESLNVGSNRSIDVGSNQKVSIGGNHNSTVSKNEVHTVALTRTHSVGINEMINVGAAQEVSVGGIRLVTVGVSQMVNVGMKHSLNAGTEIKLSSKKILLEASQELTLRCGGGTITIDSGGNITITGTLVKINC